MKIDLTETQWRDIEICLLMGISFTEKHSSIKFKENPLITRYLKTYDQIAEATDRKQNKCS